MKQCCRCHIYDNYPVWKTISRKSIADVVPGDEDHTGDGPQLHEHHPHGVAEGAATLSLCTRSLLELETNLREV